MSFHFFWIFDLNNITWVYHINNISNPIAPWNTISSYYPGDDYIDWIGVSVYGPQLPNEKWISFENAFKQAYEEIIKLTNKPIAIVEFGAIEEKKEYEKAEWIKNMFFSLNSGNYPRVKAISYWHSQWTNRNGTISNLRIDSSLNALDALKTSLNNSNIKTNTQFTNLKKKNY